MEEEGCPETMHPSPICCLDSRFTESITFSNRHVPRVEFPRRVSGVEFPESPFVELCRTRITAIKVGCVSDMGERRGPALVESLIERVR